jgi:hypothetical protein
MLNTVSLKRLTSSLIRITVLAAMMIGIAAIANAQPTSPVTSPTTGPFVSDMRACGDLSGAYAQTAAIYRVTNEEGNNTGLLMYEINDNSVPTYLGEVPNHSTIDDALTKAQASGAPESFFSADTYSVSALPSGLCQFTSLQIPTDEGKPFTCTFTCN